MRAQRQLIQHDPDNGKHGDCHRTCWAVIFDLNPEDVPHFCDGDVIDWKAEERAWLASRGLAPVTIGYNNAGLDLILTTLAYASPGVPCILGGKSSLGCNHSVVVLDGEIFCDPSGNGIVGPMSDGFWWITFAAPLPTPVEAETEGNSNG